MKISYQWLKELVDLPWSADDLPEKLSSLGFPVEGIVRQGVQVKGVIAVKILSVEKHPNADRLRIATVTDGKAERAIVCGAPNIAPGQVVPLAMPGTKLPGGIEIAISKIRGVESAGMLCSERELGLSEEHAGILQLPEGTRLGQSVSDALGGDDVIFDVEVTPNRPDVLSHVGLARELAALAKSKLLISEEKRASQKEPTVDIEIAEPSLCHRYLGRVIRDIRVGPTPDWMARRLTACGIRSINNIVDITNYVLLEWGHPLHAFDLSRLKGPAIRVRRAKAGERFVALDERTYDLTSADLVVADKEEPVAIAGIMGGQSSGVSGSTSHILLESAVFDRSAIRQTSRRLGLKSESSYRFEKGTDAETAERAWRRATQLITELAGGKPAGDRDVNPTKRKPITVTLDKSRLEALLGLRVPEATVKDVLTRLGFDPKPAKSGWTCKAPSHRKDIVEEADVAEEVIRLVGYNAIPITLSKFRIAKLESTYRPIPTDRIVESLRASGLNETLTSSLCPSDWPAKFGTATEEVVSLANPISQDDSVLRPTLAINLLRATIRNVNHQRASVALFEIGKTFSAGEESKLGLVMYGPVSDKSWQGPEHRVDIFSLKGVLEALRLDTKTEFALIPGSNLSFLHPHQSFTITFRGRPAGWAGLLNPRLSSELDLGAPCAIAEMDLAIFSQFSSATVAALPKYPFVERDIAVIVDDTTSWGSLQKATRSAAGEMLKSIYPFDVFSGGSLPSGKKSIAFRIRLQDPSKTLSEGDINATVERVKDALQTTCGAQLR